MCGNIPILVGSGIGILYYNTSLDEEAADISLCSEIKQVVTTFQIAAHALCQMHRNFYCNLIILQHQSSRPFQRYDQKTPDHRLKSFQKDKNKNLTTKGLKRIRCATRISRQINVL